MLERLEQAWADAGVPVAQLLPPGRNPAEVREALSPIVEQVPEDIITWFSWHDGGPTHAALPMAPSRFLGNSLQRTLELRLELLDEAQEIARSEAAGNLRFDPPEHLWSPSWLPIGYDGGGGSLVVDLVSPDPIRTGTVYSVDWSNGDCRQPRAPSLIDVVEMWLTVLPMGLWRWDQDEEVWDRRTNDPPWAATTTPI